MKGQGEQVGGGLFVGRWKYYDDRGEGGLLWHTATNKHFHDDVLREIERRCFKAYYLSIKADADAAASLCLVIWLMKSTTARQYKFRSGVTKSSICTVSITPPTPLR